MLRWIVLIATIITIAGGVAAQIDTPGLIDDSDPRIGMTGICAQSNPAGRIYSTATRHCVHLLEYTGSAITVYAFATSGSQSVQICVKPASEEGWSNCESLIYNAAGSSSATYYVSSASAGERIAVRITSTQFAHLDAVLIQPLPVVEVEGGAVNVYVEWINPDDISRPQEWLVPVGDEGAQGAVIATITAGDVYNATLLTVLVFSLWAFGLYFSIVRRSRS